MWAGSDDGSVHYSPDGGKTWLNRSPKDLPKWTGIYSIEVSSHDPGTVYIAPNRHELSDHTPYFEMTTDYGKTWRRIDSGIPDGDYAWVIREDPVRRGLLFAGTEGGIFVSFDDGANWQSLRRNMPIVAVRDMKVKNDDLIAATHGRAFWILDGLHVLREITPEVTRSSVHLFTVPLTYRLMGPGFDFDRLAPTREPRSGLRAHFWTTASRCTRRGRPMDPWSPPTSTRGRIRRRAWWSPTTCGTSRMAR